MKDFNIKDHPFSKDKEARRAARMENIKNLRQVVKQSAPLVWDSRDRFKGQAQEQGDVISQAMSKASECVRNFEWPIAPNLKYSGIREAGKGQSDDGCVMVAANIRTVSGMQKDVYIPVPIQGGKALEPSILMVDGTMRVWAQSVVDEIICKGTLYEPVLDRKHMFATPEVGMNQEGWNSRDYNPVVRERMFSIPANKQALRDAIAGKTIAQFGDRVDREEIISRVIDMLNEQYSQAEIEQKISIWTSESPLNILEDAKRRLHNDKTAQDSTFSHIDPSEQDQNDWMKPGAKIKTTRGKRCRNRGGGTYVVPRGSDGVVKEDLFGDGTKLRVKLEGNPNLVIFDRLELKKATVVKESQLQDFSGVPVDQLEKLLHELGKVQPQAPSTIDPIIRAIVDELTRRESERTAQTDDAILSEIKQMATSGYGPLDIIIAIKQKFGEEAGNKALERAKQERIIVF